MKALKIGLAVLAAVLLSSSCFASAPETPFLAAGSSAAFNAYSLAGVAPVAPPGSTVISSIVVSSLVGTVTCTGDCDVVAGDSFTISNVGTPSSCPDGTYSTTAGNLTLVSATSFKINITGPCANGTYHASSGHISLSSSTTGTVPLCTNTPNGTGPTGLTGATNVWIWSQKSSHTYITAADSRGPTSTSIPNATAKAWVEWVDPVDATGTDVQAVCVYLALDSGVGQRVFFATSNVTGLPAGTISCTNGSFPIATDNQMDSSGANIFPAEYSLPLTVCDDINGLPWNVAPTDIRSEDAELQITRICGAYTTTGTGYGYGCTAALGGISSFFIESAYSNTGINPVLFSISGNDPIPPPGGGPGKPLAHSLAGVDKLAYKEFDTAGQVIVPLVNKTDTSGLGAAGFTDINHVALTNVFTGHADYVSDICDPAVCTDGAPLTVLVREPPSGTYTTWEFQVPRVNETSTLSQEDLGLAGGTTYIQNKPADTSVTTFAPKYTGTSNPFAAKQTTSGAIKARVYGTGEMINVLAENAKDPACVVNSCATVAPAALFTTTNNDLIGYAYFSYGNVAPLSGDGKYLTVDGVDPFNGSFGAVGTLPNGCAAPPCATDFTNINNGKFRLWNVLRTTTSGELGYVISGSSPGSYVCGPAATVCQMVNAVESYITYVQDLTPLSAMTVFRSHYTATTGGAVGHNGFKSGLPEAGGDVKGAILTKQSETDFIADFNAEQLNELQ